jgi:hypothetical protein
MKVWRFPSTYYLPALSRCPTCGDLRSAIHIWMRSIAPIVGSDSATSFLLPHSLHHVRHP